MGDGNTAHNLCGLPGSTTSTSDAPPYFFLESHMHQSHSRQSKYALAPHQNQPLELPRSGTMEVNRRTRTAERASLRRSKRGRSGHGFMHITSVGEFVFDAMEGLLDERLKKAFRWRPETAVNRNWDDVQKRRGGPNKVMDFGDAKEWTDIPPRIEH